MLLLILLSLLVSRVYCKIPVVGTQLYYKDSQLYTFNEAMKFCINIGGEPPHDFGPALINILLPTLSDYDVGYWLDGEHGRGGYRWQKTGIPIPADLWESNEPNCDSRMARSSGCRVSIHPKSGKLYAHQGSDRMHALCAVPFTDSESVAKLRSKAPSVMTVEDRIEIEKILMRQEIEQERGGPGHEVDLKLQNLENKVDSVAKLVKGLSDDLLAKGDLFPIIRYREKGFMKGFFRDN